MKTIIYILGDGRSGSTILEDYISQHIDGVKIGEARRFWLRYYDGDTYCECGQHLCECNFWSSVEEKLDHKFRNKNIHNEINNDLGFKNARNFIERDDGNKRLKETQESFYNSISQTSDAEYIIDSSKIYPWAIHLDKFTNQKVIFIHLVRDIADVANSWKKDIYLPEYISKKVKMPKRSFVNHFKTWWKINLTTLSYFKNKENYIYLDYREFCNNPISIIQTLNKYGIESCQGEEPMENNNHGIGGNPIRTGNDTTIKITYNSSRNNLKSWEKAAYFISNILYNLVRKFYAYT